MAPVAVLLVTQVLLVSRKKGIHIYSAYTKSNLYFTNTDGVDTSFLLNIKKKKKTDRVVLQYLTNMGYLHVQKFIE